jgi:uridine phosphorylase
MRGLTEAAETSILGAIAFCTALTLAPGEEIAMPYDIPIIEFDPTQEALIEPRRVIQQRDAPTHCVLCFFREVLERVALEHDAKVVYTQKCEIGEWPLYEIEYRGQRLGICQAGVGAPLAAGWLEELIAVGCREFVVCGGAGVLDRAIAVGHLLVPTAAVRDEGTSYHYLPPSREVQGNPESVAVIERTLQRAGVDYLLCKTWTTDAFYRETTARIQRRKAEGCLAVEMEAAAYFAVAAFRGVKLGQILYGGDDISGDDWDSRSWQLRTPVREKVFWLAAEACLQL